MSNRLVRPAAALLGLACVLPLPAAAHPPAAKAAPAGKSDLRQADMLDARVNARQAYVSATGSREAAVRAAHRAAGSSAQALATAAQAFERTHPGARIDRSPLTGAPMTISATRAPLTAASTRGNEAIVRDFLSAQRAVYGFSSADLADLEVRGDSAGGGSGLRMLRMEQEVAGRPVFQSETRFLIDAQGRLVKATGQLVPNARGQVDAFDAGALLDAPQAVVKLLESTGKTASAASFTLRSAADGRFDFAESDAHVAGDITAREVLFPITPGLLVPAWSLVVFTEGEQDWYAVVDAETGDVLWRKNIRNEVSAHDARFRVYVQADGTTPADNPAPHSPTTVVPGSGTQFPAIAPTIVGMHAAMNAAASPNGWIDDCPGGVCSANETQTLGNNAVACLDRAAPANVCDTDAASVLDGSGRPTGNPDANGRNRDFLGTAPRDFQTGYLPSPQGGNPEAGQTTTGSGNNGTTAVDQFRRGAVTQLFYVTNWYHDRLFSLGFDEASANFQQTNFSGTGLGGDRVQADAQDASGSNNANFATPPDGSAGRMQMFRFTGPTIDRDGGLDSEIVIHELTHGLSNRLVGNAAGLNWDVARGMGEGWSDFYALSLLNATNADDPDGSYASGGYATYKLVAGYLDNYLYGIRRFPYSTDNTVNPLTWADVDDVTNDLGGGIAPSPVDFNGAGGMEVHNSGEIWALSLWEVRSRIIADPAGANGDVPTGNQTTLQLVTDALKMTPVDPTFIEARDALLDADCATNGCANEQSIWAGFADRGLGYSADAPYGVVYSYNTTESHMGVTEAFDLPHLDVADASADVAIDDAVTNGNGAIDPGEAVRLTVALTNPWRAAARAVPSASATLTSPTPGVTVYAAEAGYGAIAPSGSATGEAFVVGIAPSVVCGTALEFTLTTTSALGTTSTTFVLRVGTPKGTGAPVTFTSDPSPDIAIPDDSARGVGNAMTIADDLEIADLDLRIDGITHTFTGDLSVMLRGPTGLGVDMISLIGGLTDSGPGDNIVDMVIDDDVASIPANDMVQAVGTAAPYSRSWLPVFNAPWSSTIGLQPDPVGNLSRYDGMRTRGTWSVRVADQAAADTGTLDAWSIIVTPVAFSCSTAGIGADVGAANVVSGTFAVGGTVTYTIVLTNDGGALQGDNPGDEFTDTFNPAAMTVTSATASSGTAAMAGNTVTWNGTLAPLGGSTTITVTAVVLPGTEGATILNAGTVNFDGDADGSNESSRFTDDPTLPGVNDATVFEVGFADVSADKTVAGSFGRGGNVTYTLLLANAGNQPAADNAGDELVDVLPAGLTLVSASATSGTAVADIGTNTVTWNGAIPAAGSVTVTIAASVDADASGTQSNQATLNFDGNLDGSNESSVPSDDPGVGGASDPTTFEVLLGALGIAPASVDFGDQPVGTPSGVQFVTLDNGGGSALSVTTLDAAAGAFARDGGTCPAATPFTLAAGAECTLGYRFTPVVGGAASLTIDVATDVPDGGSFTLEGNGLVGAFGVSPGALPFGEQPVDGTSAPRVATLANTGAADLQVTAIEAAAAPFARSGGDCPAVLPFTLAAGTDCTLEYVFEPIAAGAASQELSIASSVGDSSITLSGTGTQGVLAVSPTVDFGGTAVGSESAAAFASITNTGDAAIEVTGIETPTAPFARVGGSCAAPPFTLAPGTGCTLQYTFSPTTTGPATQALTVDSDAGDGDIVLSGTGTQGALAVLSPVAFGEVEVGTDSAPLAATLSNTGDADIEVTAIDAATAPFAAAGGSCGALPIVLAPDASCTLLYTFSPTAAGAATQTLDVAADAGAGQIVLQGTGTQAEASLSAGTLAFGAVEPGASDTGDVTLTNTGDAPLTVTAVGTPDAPFSAAGGSCGAVPFALAPGEGCTLAFAFAPTDGGSFTSEVDIASNGGALSLVLTGTGGADVPPIPVPAVIPTLSTWMLMLLAGFVLLIAGAAVRRQS